MAVIVLALRRLVRKIYSNLFEFAFAGFLFSWDAMLVLGNLLTPKLAEGKVIASGKPGAGGAWPEYIPPTEDASRCSCPALNAMANHGILPRDGRNIPFTELNRTARETYNFAPTFCVFVPRYIARILNRTYSTDTCDLSDIDVHNGIEHDGSLLREDTYHKFHQGLPSAELVTKFLASATGPAPKPPKLKVQYPDGPPAPPFSPLTEDIDLDTTITQADLSLALSEARRRSRQLNPQYSLDHGHKNFGSSNASTMLTIFGGRVRDLATILIEERLPDGWEPRVRDRFGLTMAKFNMTVMPVEMGVRDEVERPLNLW
ncbi:Cloroperoxidase [Peniophora sp. CONT]|nr:Cloroperoxidase [Peniophora sp. CONT]